VLLKNTILGPQLRKEASTRAGQVILKKYRHAVSKDKEVHRESDHGRWPFQMQVRASLGICDFRPCVTGFASRWKVRLANHRIRVAALPVAPSKSLSTIENLDGKCRSPWTVFYDDC